MRLYLVNFAISFFLFTLTHTMENNPLLQEVVVDESSEQDQPPTDGIQYITEKDRIINNLRKLARFGLITTDIFAGLLLGYNVYDYFSYNCAAPGNTTSNPHCLLSSFTIFFTFTCLIPLNGIYYFVTKERRHT